MLTGKLEVIIFQEAVHEDDGFAHAGGQGHPGFFPCGAEALIERFEDAVVAHGTQGRHVEGAADGPPSAADVAHPLLRTALAVAGGDAGQGGGRLGGEFSQFGHFCQHGGRDDRTDAGDGVQAFGFARQLGILGHQGGDGFIAWGHLLFQSFEELAGLAAAERIGVMLGAIALGGLGVDELAAARGQIGQALLLGGSRRGGRGREGFAVVGEHGGIEGIGLGPLALVPGEGADAPGFHDADGDVGRVEDADDGLFVTARGFAGEGSVGTGAQEFEEFGVTLGIVGQGVGTRVEIVPKSRLPAAAARDSLQP